jgi:2-oxoglutarate/2-oxoacid ferredoxin oxidoreductase subunit alpha
MATEKSSVARFELLMDAGYGAQKAGDILIRAFAHSGKFVYIEPMIPAEISPPPRSRPALSGVIIRIAEYDLTNIGNYTDFLIAQHEIVLDRRLDDQEHSPNCRVFLDMGDQKANPESYQKVIERACSLGLKIIPFAVTENTQSILKELGGKGKNIFYLGMLSHLCMVSEDAMIKEIHATFGKKLSEEIFNKNIQLFHEGFALAPQITDFPIDVANKANTQGDHLLIDGNTAMSMGLIDAGVKLISGYPITPASSILHTLAKVMPSYGGMVHQAEDEISAIGTAIGSYFAGVPAATVTSGPGLSLKQEFLGYASVAEIPLILINVQRSGPSTGMPTKTEQSDLLAGIYGTHGDNTKIIIGVGSVLDCFYAPKLARYLTEKLRLPVIIMSDFQIANSYKVIPQPKLSSMNERGDVDPFILEYFQINPLPNEIEMVRNEQANPGTPGKMRRTTGLNTDAEGKVNYFAKTNHRAHAVRNEKIHHVRRALKKPILCGGVEEGDLLVCGWGATRGSIQEAVRICQEEGLHVGGLCFNIVYPLPLMIGDIFKRFKKIVTVEMAYGDKYKRTPLAMFLRTKTLRDVTPMICRATGRPISPKIIKQHIRDMLSGKELNYDI